MLIKNPAYIILLLSLFAITAKAATEQTARQLITLQEGWLFAKGAQQGAEQAEFDDSAWQAVSVPHDWAIGEDFIIDGDGDTGKLPWRGQAWYRTALPLTEQAEGKNIYLIFDGVMAFPKVYVNGKLAGQWDYGYSSFYLNISNLVKPGQNNILTVHADTREHGSRWYPGAGIYRKVQMLVTDPLHVGVWGTSVRTPILKPKYALARINTTVHNNSLADIDKLRLEHLILNSQGQVVARDELTASLAAGQHKDLEANIDLNNPQRWDIDNPHLYTVLTQVFKGDQLCDTYETRFGVRSIRFDADHGFYLNERRVQLKGVNLHHGHGALGAAFYPRAMQRKLEIMKDMGVNAIRSSHNVPAPEVLELADEMGLLVFNEAFDKYTATADITEETDFDEFAKRNIRNFVLRDRNHPSVFLWSVGNEMGDEQWNKNNGHQKLHTMLNYVNKYDPSRPVTMVTDNLKGASTRHFDYYDVHAWNYGRRYRLARQMEPNKAVIISESASTVSTRGVYEFPLPEEPTDFTKSLQLSSYDLHAPYWAEIADDDFMWQEDEPYIAGEFVWTGFDYLGEPTPYNNKSVKEMGMDDKAASRSSYFGIVDLMGIPKDRFYLYQAHWRPDYDSLHILPHWNWPERVGQVVPVFAYTNGDCGELFVNNKSRGLRCKKTNSENSTERYRLMWKEVVYEPGEIRVIATREGKKIAESNVITAGVAHNIKLTADRYKISADGMDLSYVLVEAFDKDGNPQPLADNQLNIKVSGAGSLAGAGNGNPQSFDPFQDEYVNLFYGKAMIILRSKAGEAGRIKLSVSADGMKGADVAIRTE